jgi:long-chain acyl-CoA synthetase
VTSADTGTELRTIPDLFFRRSKISAAETALLHKQGGSWLPITWGELEKSVREIARAVSDWIAPKEMACILSENRPEWWMVDLATLSIGGVTAPIYPTNPPKDIAYILNDCEAKLLFLSTADQLKKIRALRAENRIPNVKWVVVFDEVKPEPGEDWVMTLSTLRGRNQGADDPIPARLASLSGEDLATIIYTSGTTGEPKGVMLRHRNLVSNTLGAHVLIDGMELPEKLMLSFLPLSHSFERTAGYYVAIHFGFKVAFAESVPKLVDNMAEVRPTMLVSVPRIYEKLYAKVMEGARSGIKRTLVLWALSVGKEHAYCRIEGKAPPAMLELKYKLATKLVFSKIHERMGGRLKYAISGGAALAKEIGEFLGAIGLSVCEGYGLSETSPVLAANRPDAIRVGSVGKAWPGVELKIQPEPDRERDGEILARGEPIMVGYYKKPEATSEAIDKDGWFHTGDIGYLDSDGFLFITDRKKELIKTAGGKYVAPQPIENKLKVHSLIEQAVVIGDKRKYCVTLLVPKFEALENTLGRPLPNDRSQLNSDPQVKNLFQSAIDEINKDLGSWEQIKRFHLLPAEMTQETGELTPSLKIKRRIVDAKYKEIIDSLYPPA